MTAQVTFSVFTKPWKTPLPELGVMVQELGFDGIELPVRPGYQVEPHRITSDLPVAVRQLTDAGVRITSVASEPTEPLIATCAEYGIPIIRTMAPIGADGYLATEARLQKHYDELLPLLQKYNVKLGVQNHNGQYVCNASGLRSLIGRFDPRTIGAIWDVSHNALNGEAPEMALDLVWSHLCMVNFKNAFWRRASGPEAEDVQWEVYWTSGRQGLASWPRVAAELKRRSYTGVICLSAEYTDEEAVKRLTAEDIAFARTLFAS